MSNQFEKILANIMPFIVIGIAIALLIGFLFLFFYVAIWGILIGGILWLAALAKQYFFPNKPAKQEKGRVIEHDDKK